MAMEWSSKRVARWLTNEVKLPRYAPLFLQRDIHLSYLLGLSEEDLEHIGVHDKNDQRQIQNAILQLWGRVDAGQSLEDGDDDDDITDSTPNVESEQDDQDYDVDLARQHEELRLKRLQYEEREREREQTTRRLIRSFGIDPNLAPEPIRLRGELGSVDEELFVPPPAGDIGTDHVESMATADAQFEELENCHICMEEKLSHEMALFSCQHSFCYTCSATYIQSKLSENQLVVCPTCSIELTKDDIERILSPPVFGPSRY